MLIAYLNYDPWVVSKDYINNLIFLCTLTEEYVLYTIYMGLLQFSCILEVLVVD